MGASDLSDLGECALSLWLRAFVFEGIAQNGRAPKDTSSVMKKGIGALLVGAIRRPAGALAEKIDHEMGRPVNPNGGGALANVVRGEGVDNITFGWDSPDRRRSHSTDYSLVALLLRVTGWQNYVDWLLR